MSKELPTLQEWLKQKRTTPMNSRQRAAATRYQRQKRKRIAKRRAVKVKQDSKMRYTPKERSTYRAALRYGRTIKADGKFRAAPRLKFDGGRLAVMRDSRGNVHIRANASTKGSVRALGPRGVKDEHNMTSLMTDSFVSVEEARKVGARRDKLLSIVGKGTYKKGSTGRSSG